MADLIDVLRTFLPLALPIALAVVLGRSLSTHALWWIGSVGLAVASLYPILHWYVLHDGFGVQANPNDKDEVIGSFVIWLIMLIEVPICFLLYLVVRSISRHLRES